MIPSGGETRKPCGRREEVPELVRSKIGKDPALRSERERGGGESFVTVRTGRLPARAGGSRNKHSPLDG